MIKYMTMAHGSSYARIDKVEVEKETEKMVVLQSGRKEAKKSDWHNYFDTWGEALEFLRLQANNKIINLKFDLNRAIDESKRLNSLRPPE